MQQLLGLSTSSLSLLKKTATCQGLRLVLLMWSSQDNQIVDSPASSETTATNSYQSSRPETHRLARVSSARPPFKQGPLVIVMRAGNGAEQSHGVFGRLVRGRSRHPCQLGLARPGWLLADPVASEWDLGPAIGPVWDPAPTVAPVWKPAPTVASVREPATAVAPVRLPRKLRLQLWRCHRHAAVLQHCKRVWEADHNRGYRRHEQKEIASSH